MVEVFAKLLIGDRQIGADARCQIAVGDLLQGGAECLADQRALGRQHFFLDGALLGDIGRIHVDGDRQIHIEEDALDEARQHRAHVFGRGGLARKQTGLRPVRTNDFGNQMFGDQRIAADVPARLKADARVDLADGADLGTVLFIEIGVGDVCPVTDLRALGAVDMAVGRKEPFRLGRRLHLAIELVERRLQLLFKDRLQRLEARSGGIVERHEIQTTGNILRTGSGVFRFHARASLHALVHVPVNRIRFKDENTQQFEVIQRPLRVWLSARRCCGSWKQDRRRTACFL
ncbi:hypothetical protein D9M70_488800 [compost metagenome]